MHVCIFPQRNNVWLFLIKNRLNFVIFDFVMRSQIRSTVYTVFSYCLCTKTVLFLLVFFKYYGNWLSLDAEWFGVTFLIHQMALEVAIIMHQAQAWPHLTLFACMYSTVEHLAYVNSKQDLWPNQSLLIIISQ